MSLKLSPITRNWRRGAAGAGLSLFVVRFWNGDLNEILLYPIICRNMRWESLSKVVTFQK